MLFSHKSGFFSYRFFKTSLRKVCEACPEIRLPLEIHPIFQLIIGHMDFFGSPAIGTIGKNHIQSSSVLLRTALFLALNLILS